MQQKIRLIAKKVKNHCFPSKPSLTEVRLSELAKSCDEYIIQKNIQFTLKVLWPTLFNQDKTFWAHDGVLILALRLRGVDVIPTMCDKLQADECVIHGGLWQNSYQKMYGETRESLCKQCVNHDLQLWNILKINPIRLSSYITEGERAIFCDKVKEIMATDWQQYKLGNFPVGKEAWKAVVNLNLQGEIKPHWKKEADKIAANHIFNILVLFHVYQRVLTAFSPDRIVGNGGFYYQWGVLNHICQELNLSYYRYYAIGLQPNSWNYALNSTEMVHLTPAWQSWIKEPWDVSQEKRVIEDLKLRGHYVDPSESLTIKAHNTAFQQKLGLDPSKKTALILSGVIWDAATNVESETFINMYEWLFATIEWFAQHSEFQLIIRIHPAENIAKNIAPLERTKLEKEIKERNIVIPKNVFLILPEENVGSYDLMHLADVGIVYTSTTGLEFACLEKPIISIGPSHYRNKGFTFDPKTRQEYFTLLEYHLTHKWQKENAKKHQQLAMKYWYLYAFHGSTVTNLFETNVRSLAIKRGIEVATFHPKKLTAKDILPGANEQIDYFCNAIINNLPFMGEKRWPPLIADELCKM